MLETLLFPLVIFVLVNLLFAISLVKVDFGVIDIGWGLGISLISILSLLLKTHLDWHIVLLNTFVILWGFRLSIYILVRGLGKSEDFRYKKMRDKWGESTLFKGYLFIFLGQGLLMLLMTLPALTLHFEKVPKHYPLINTIGLLFFIFGFFLESYSDYSLLQFKKLKENEGKILQSGLWKYSRHPNYLGEVLLWWGLFFFSFQGESSWIAIIAPILITFLIIKVSGIPLLENRFKDDPEYEKYRQKTSVLLPSTKQRPNFK